MKSLFKALKYLLLAVQFLTRFPVGIQGDISDRELGRAAAAFPVVGIMIGGLLVLVYYLAATVFGDEIAALLAVTALVCMTGGLHVDGFMDTADGVFSGRRRERMLEIMKDSRVGAMGVIACVLLLGSQFLLLHHIPRPDVYQVILIFPVLGRWMMVWVIAMFPYARAGAGTGRPFADYVGTGEVVVATVISLVYVATISGLAGTILMAAAAVAGLGSAWFLSARLHGLTGDTYGAIDEVVETVVLLLAVVMAGYGWF